MYFPDLKWYTDIIPKLEEYYDNYMLPEIKTSHFTFCNSVHMYYVMIINYVVHIHIYVFICTQTLHAKWRMKLDTEAQVNITCSRYSLKC